MMNRELIQGRKKVFLVTCRNKKKNAKKSSRQNENKKLLTAEWEEKNYFMYH